MDKENVMIETSYRPVDDYFAAKKRKDVEAMLASFTPEAVVEDEGGVHRGHTAIRAWMEETMRKYGDTAEPAGVKEEDGRVEVAALVYGNFPGSPTTLHFAFRLRDGRIAGLEIGA
jgi:ketosteroid isomerase-like protein